MNFSQLPGTKTSAPIIDDARLKPIAARVLAGERLSFEDGVALYRSPDLLALGWLANQVREKHHGDVCYFNVNRHINPTNVCVAHCKLCAFGRRPDAPGIPQSGAHFPRGGVFPRVAILDGEPAEHPQAAPQLPEGRVVREQ